MTTFWICIAIFWTLVIISSIPRWVGKFAEEIEAGKLRARKSIESKGRNINV